MQKQEKAYTTFESLSKSKQTLALWIINQYKQHRARGAIPGQTLKIAKARRFLKKSDFPEDAKKGLLAQLDWMLREHAEAAQDVLAVNEAVKSGKPFSLENVVRIRMGD
jgi:hypothetical protein